MRPAGRRDPAMVLAELGYVLVDEDADGTHAVRALAGEPVPPPVDPAANSGDATEEARREADG